MRKPKPPDGKSGDSGNDFSMQHTEIDGYAINLTDETTKSFVKLIRTIIAFSVIFVKNFFYPPFLHVS